MSNTVQKKHSNHWIAMLVICLLTLTTTTTQAEVRLSTDWQSAFRSDGSIVEDREDVRLDKAAEAMASQRTAAIGSTILYQLRLGFKMHLDGVLYYLQPATFMRKRRADETCTPDYKKGVLKYSCVEGQRQTNDCHLLFIDRNFKEAGYHDMNIKELYPYFCNAIPAIGTGNKAENEILVTVQYFPIDRKLASKVSDIGSEWKRMTLLVRIKAENGKIVVEQDDSCLGNPNNYEDVPSARKALARCVH